MTKIRDQSKRYHTSLLSCTECKKEEREASKRQQLEEDRIRSEIDAQRQQEMFRKAREEMEKE